MDSSESTVHHPQNQFFLHKINEICAVCNKKFKNNTTDKLLLTRSLTKPEFEPVHAYKVLESISQFRYMPDGPQHLCGNCYHNTVMAFQFQRICNRAQSNFEAWKEHPEVSSLEENKEDITSSENTEVKRKQKRTAFLKYIYKGQKLFEELPDAPKVGKRPSRNVKCLKCGDIMTYMKFRDHIFKHTGTKPYKCQQCDAAFLRSMELSNHVKSVHENRRDNVCDKCGKAFFHRQAWKKHVLSHIGYKCKQCDKICSTSSGLHYHMTKSHSTPFTCEYCGKIYRIEKFFLLHVDEHIGSNKYVCEICLKGFSEPWQLKLHFKLHRATTPLDIESAKQEEQV